MCLPSAEKDREENKMYAPQENIIVLEMQYVGLVIFYCGKIILNNCHTAWSKYIYHYLIKEHEK